MENTSRDVILQRRRRDRDELIALAREFVARVRRSMTIEAAFIAGSVARGDFNVWSDVDVVIVAPNLPSRMLDRSMFFASLAPPGIQVVAYTPDEFEQALARRNPLAVEATVSGIVL